VKYKDILLASTLKERLWCGGGKCAHENKGKGGKAKNKGSGKFHRRNGIQPKTGMNETVVSVARITPNNTEIA